MKVNINRNNNGKYVRNLYGTILKTYSYDEMIHNLVCVQTPAPEIGDFHVCLENWNDTGYDIYPYIIFELNGELKLSPLTTILLALYGKTIYEFKQDWDKILKATITIDL